jgi:hypothetical protein
MKKTLISILVVSFGFATSSFGQDLNRLQDRAQKLLSLRSIDKNPLSKKTDAAPYIETKSRDKFLDLSPFPMQDARVSGFEFTNDPKLVYVLFKAKVVLPELGPVPRTGREPWVWDKKDWFLTLPDDDDPVFANVRAPKPPSGIPFDLAQDHVDLGKHVQGDVVRQTLKFKSNKDAIVLFRSSDGLPGLSVSAPDWKSNDEAELQVVLDTVLLSKDVRYTVALEIQGSEGQTLHSSFDLTAQIEPRLRITQVPAIIDPSKAGTVEIEMENLSKEGFQFMLPLTPTNPEYQIVGSVPEGIEPGQTVKLKLKYIAQLEPLGAQIALKLSRPVVGRDFFGFPLKINFPVQGALMPTREQLEEIIRKSKQPDQGIVSPRR